MIAGREIPQHPTSSERLLALVSGYPPRLWNDKRLVMLQAYIDDSASDTGDRRLYFVGYVNTAENWIAFSEEWDRVLHEEPAIEYLHMVEANGLRDQFRGWTEAARDKKLLDLASVINRFEPWSFECSVSQNDHDRILKPVAPYGLGTPYFSCFVALVVSLARYHAHENIRTPVDFIFDKQSNIEPTVGIVYEFLKSIQTPEIQNLLGSTPIFRDDQDILPLQAADMLAWHIRRESQNLDGANSRPVIDLLRVSGRHAGADVTPEYLSNIAENLKAIPGVDLLQTKSQWRVFRDENARLVAAGIDSTKVKRPGIYYPESAPALLRFIGWLRRFLGSL